MTAGLKVHEFGYVSLVDYMGTDQDIVDAARISYDRKGNVEDRNLIRYLLRKGHTSPFEMAVLKFELKMPVFVARQWVRHRTASMNEVSARYTQLPNEMFIPEVFSVQSTDNKQGRQDETSFDFSRNVGNLHAASYGLYERMLDSGVAREIARGVLPLNIYTKFVWKMDLHNLMHFLKLRLDSHAQKEIRDFAGAIEMYVAKMFPVCHEAFVDYLRDARNCSRMELHVIKELIRMLASLGDNDLSCAIVMARKAGMGKREIKEFMEEFIDERR